MDHRNIPKMGEWKLPPLRPIPSPPLSRHSSRALAIGNTDPSPEPSSDASCPLFGLRIFPSDVDPMQALSEHHRPRYRHDMIKSSIQPIAHNIRMIHDLPANQ
jgi:hypothetical protein